MNEYTRCLRVVFSFVKTVFSSQERHIEKLLKEFGSKDGFRDFFEDPMYKKEETRIDTRVYRYPEEKDPQ